jgi:hypothetical protein
MMVVVATAVTTPVVTRVNATSSLDGSLLFITLSPNLVLCVKISFLKKFDASNTPTYTLRSFETIFMGKSINI